MSAIISYNKKIAIRYKKAIGIFESINGDKLNVESRPLTASRNPTNVICSHPTFTKTLFPTIIGISHTDTKFVEKVKLEVEAFSLIVPLGGLDLNIRASFNMDNVHTKEELKSFIVKNGLPEDITADALYKKIVDTVEPIDLHKYLTFDSIDSILSYYRWIHCIHSSVVANTPEDCDKSENIRFFIYDYETAAAKSNKSFEKIEEALDAIKALRDEKKVKTINALVVALNVVPVDEIDVLEFKSLYYKLYEYTQGNPDSVLEKLKDPHFKSKVFAEDMRKAQVLFVNEHGDYVDSNDSSKVIGSIYNDASITEFLNAEENQAYIVDLKKRSKAE